MTEKDNVKKVWHCRALPFDKDLIGGNKNILNLKQNVFIREIPKEWDSKTLEEKFAAVGPVKSAKVSMSPVIKVETVEGKKYHIVQETEPCSSNGYGFVCFENEEHAKQVIEAGKFDAVLAVKYEPKDPKETKNKTNNVYMKNFDPSWDEAKIKEVFSKFGPISSVYIKEDATNKDRKFAFVCFTDPENPNQGYISAERAIQELNDKEDNGFKLYVQPALTAIQRQVVIQRE